MAVLTVYGEEKLRQSSWFQEILKRSDSHCAHVASDDSLQPIIKVEFLTKVLVSIFVGGQVNLKNRNN